MNAIEAVTSPLDVIRIVNAVLTIVAAFGLLFVYNADFARLARGVRVIVFGQLLLLTSVSISSVVALYNTTSILPRVLVAAACLTIIAGVALDLKDRLWS